MNYIGIDPGVAGGIAVLDDRGRPVYTGKLGTMTPRDVLDVLEAYDQRKLQVGNPMDPGREAVAALERVNAGVFGNGKAGRMGVSSAFTFGRGVGLLQMALTAARIPFDQVAPAAWQQALGCRTKGDKNISKARAQQLFPTVNVTHAIADALLLAEFCRRTQQAHGSPHHVTRGVSNGKAQGRAQGGGEQVTPIIPVWKEDGVEVYQPKADPETGGARPPQRTRPPRRTADAPRHGGHARSAAREAGVRRRR